LTLLYVNDDEVVHRLQFQHSISKVQRSRCTWVRRFGPGQSSWECP